MCLDETGLRLKCPNCRNIFFICLRCYRGHKYCSITCSNNARRQSRKRSDQHYRVSPQGRRNHRLAQDRYRKKKINVIEHTSTLRPSPVKKNSQTLGLPPTPTFMKCVVCRSKLIHLWTGDWRNQKKGEISGNKPRNKSLHEKDVLRRSSDN